MKEILLICEQRQYCSSTHQHFNTTKAFFEKTGRDARLEPLQAICWAIHWSKTYDELGIEDASVQKVCARAIVHVRILEIESNIERLSQSKQHRTDSD